MQSPRLKYGKSSNRKCKNSRITHRFRARLFLSRSFRDKSVFFVIGVSRCFARAHVFSRIRETGSVRSDSARNIQRTTKGGKRDVWIIYTGRTARSARAWSFEVSPSNPDSETDPGTRSFPFSDALWFRYFECRSFFFAPLSSASFLLSPPGLFADRRFRAFFDGAEEKGRERSFLSFSRRISPKN